MSLLDEIIEAATDNKVPIGTLLRKCLVLEQQVKNDKFRAWLNNELDGYDREREDEIPPYRIISCSNKGIFLGPLGSQLNDQPIPTHVMDDQDRKFVERAILHQPAASYEARPDDHTGATYTWHPWLVAKYQTKFFKDKIVLNRAWQEIPGSVLVGLSEQIRTRVLRFALELKDNLPSEGAQPKQLPAAAVERSVVNNIYGGNVVIAAYAEQFSQFAQTNIAQGDAAALQEALRRLGVTDEGLKKLESDIEADKKAGETTMGQRVKGWLGDLGKYVGKEALTTGGEAAKKIATKWILQYYGIDIA